MFSYKRTILYPFSEELRAATGDIRTGTVLRSDYLPLEGGGLSVALQAARKEHTAAVRFIVPEEYLYLTQVTLDSDKAVRSKIASAIEDVFPESLSDIAWDFEVLSEENSRTVIELSGVTKEFGTLLAEALSGLDLRLEAVIPESYALARAVPFDETLLLIHQRGSEVMLCLSDKQKVVSALILDHRPLLSEVREFIEFGQARKECIVKKIVLSGIASEGEEWKIDAVPVVVLDTPADPIHGALLLDLSSSRDADRLDLPLRIKRHSWYWQMMNLFH